MRHRMIYLVKLIYIGRGTFPKLVKLRSQTKHITSNNSYPHTKYEELGLQLISDLSKILYGAISNSNFY